jgi:S1-C subfamily serine protease
VATLTTEAPDCPARTLLDRTDLVTRNGPFHWTVSRDVRKLAAGDPMAFVSEGAAFPNPLSFPAPGFVIAYVRPGGVLERAGFQAGDVLTQINGMPLRGLDDAFFAYGMLVDAEVLVVRIVRGVESLTQTYEFK